MVTVISPPLPRINAVISIALIALIQTEERGRGRCRANVDPERDNRFFDTPGASVGCCLRQIRNRKTKTYHWFYLLSQISQKLSRGNNLSITCHLVTGWPIILVTPGHRSPCSTGCCCPRRCLVPGAHTAPSQQPSQVRAQSIRRHSAQMLCQ